MKGRRRAYVRIRAGARQREFCILEIMVVNCQWLSFKAEGAWGDGMIMRGHIG